MTNKIVPGREPGENRRVVFISIVLLIFGVAITPMSLAAFRSGEEIPLLTKTRPIYGWEGLLTAALSEIVGCAGLWVVWRRRSTPSE